MTQIHGHVLCEECMNGRACVLCLFDLLSLLFSHEKYGLLVALIYYYLFCWPWSAFLLLSFLFLFAIVLAIAISRSSPSAMVDEQLYTCAILSH
jgi:hypothetical protein